MYLQQRIEAINSSAATLSKKWEIMGLPRGETQLSELNPSELMLEVESGTQVDILLLHTNQVDSSIKINVSNNATLRVTQILLGSASVELEVNHDSDSVSEILALSLKDNSVNFDIKLNGKGAQSQVDTIQMGTLSDDNSLMLNMRHMSPDTSSRSLSKCVASGESQLKFEGLVYVAKDAQRTLSEQNCRSIELSDMSHIVAQPQLEIYADDVKCSHGATMGQINDDAIFYMRQRGLSESQARRVQIEGFIADVVNRCADTELREALKVIVDQKQEEL